MDLAENVRTEEFFAVSLDFLDFIEKAPCDLFRRNRSGEYVLLAAQHSVLSRQAAMSLELYGTDQIYARTDDSVYYSRMLRARLDDLVANPNIESSVKARAVQATCRDAMRRAFEDPRGPFIRQACDIIVPTVDLIVSDDQATKHLVRLTAFDQATYIHSTNVGIFSVALARLFFGLDRSHDMHNLGTGFFCMTLASAAFPLISSISLGL